MINALLVDTECKTLEILTHQLTAYCPQVNVCGLAQTNEDASRMLHELHPELVFIDQSMVIDIDVSAFNPTVPAFEAILLHNSNALVANNFAFPASASLNKPVAVQELIVIVRQAEHWLLWKKEMLRNRQMLEQLFCQCPHNQLIGIPTLEGFEFIPAQDIVRCEGMQRLTKVFTVDSTVLSSYNIGEFCRILYDFGFFSPHKSHLVNLQYLRKYCTDGTITLRDGSVVPLARRRREAFLERVKHL